MLCALILYISGRTYNLKSTPNDIFFEKLFMAILFTLRVFVRNLLRGNHRKNAFCILFWCLACGWNTGFTSNKPTHYLLDHGAFTVSSRNNWSHMTIHNVVDTWNGCLNKRRWMAIIRRKFSSAMKHISHSVGMVINKIVVFVVLRILK